MKYSVLILTGFTILLGGGALIASAQSYVPLVTLPGVTESGTGVTMGAYLAGMMKFIVALAGVFAILMATIGGVQYVASGITPNAKSDAKERITNAFIGLALILVSYLILYSINPALVRFNLTLPSIVSAPVAAPTNGGGGGGAAPVLPGWLQNPGGSPGWSPAPAPEARATPVVPTKNNLLSVLFEHAELLRKEISINRPIA